MNDNFFIVGGDLRNLYLAQELSKDGKKVKIMGFNKLNDQIFVNNKIKKVYSINEKEKNDLIISSIPLTMDNKTIYTPYNNEKITLNTLKGLEFIAGKIPSFLNGKDILKDEDYTIKNIIPTVEGAISKAIEETNETIFESNVLVLGYGRIGKLLCNRLKSLGANVFCEARKSQDLTWIRTYGYIPIYIEDLEKYISKMDVIFNTIPSIILNEKLLKYVKKDSIIIDLASKPGGVDFENAKERNIKAILYSGIPGKISPRSTAKYIKEYLYSKIQ